jgi:hypothetical protein
MPASATFSASDTGFDVIDTPNPNESGVVVTVDLVAPTPGQMPQVGDRLDRLQLKQRNPALARGWEDYTFTHKRRLAKGTLSLFYAAPKSAEQRITPYHTYTEKDDGSFDAILRAVVFYRATKLPLSATLEDGSTENLSRIIAKRLYHPSYNGPCEYTVNEYLSEVPFPESLVNADDGPMPIEVSWDFVQQGGEMGRVLCPRLEINLPDPEIYEEIARAGVVNESMLSLMSQTFPATNHQTWQDYQVRFKVSRTDGDDGGQYHGRELIITAPQLQKWLLR